MKVKCAYDELVALNKLIPHPKNRNKHPKEQIVRFAKILEYQGIRRPVRVSELSGYITAGHGLYEAAKLLKWKELPVDYQQYDDESQEIADGIADNSLALWADLDMAGINMDLPDLGPDFDIDWLGIEGFTVDVAEKEGLTDADAIPEDAETKVKPGQIWILGNHRVMCGDSTDKASVDALMNGEKADMVFTDPPYGISIVSTDGSLGGGTKGKYKHVIGDETPNTAKKAYNLCASLDIETLIFWGGNHYSSSLPDSSCWIVWDKQGGKRVDFADCELAWTNIQKPVRMFTHIWDGFRRDSEQREMRVHPTQKPIKLIEDIFDLFQENCGEKCLDLFLGSGSTLIACEKTNRKCYGMEIDPHYCDVIIARWEKYTGGKAILANG